MAKRLFFYLFTFGLSIVLTFSSSFAEESIAKPNPLDDILGQLSSPSAGSSSREIRYNQAMAKLRYEINRAKDVIEESKEDLHTDSMLQENSLSYRDSSLASQKKGMIQEFQGMLDEKIIDLQKASNQQKRCFPRNNIEVSVNLSYSCDDTVSKLLDSARTLEEESHNLPLKLENVDLPKHAPTQAPQQRQESHEAVRNPFAPNSGAWW